MSQKVIQTIDLTSPDKLRSPTKDQADVGVKRLNYGGLIIEVVEPKAKKQSKTIELNIGSQDENSRDKANQRVIIRNGENPKKPQEVPKEKAKPIAKPAIIIQNKVVVNNVQNNDEGGAAGLWAIAGPAKQVPSLPIKVAAVKPKSEMSYYDELLELSKSKLHKNTEDFVCSVCQTFVFIGDGILLKGCMHNICRPCLIKEIKANSDMLGQIKCPFNGDNAESCESFIEDEEVKELLGKDYEEFALNLMQSLDKKYREEERLEEEARNKDMLPLLLQAEDLDFKDNTEAFECAICYTDAEIGEGLILKNCLHKFCKICLTEQVRHAEEFEVKCPYTDEHGSCTFMLQEREIKGIVSKELFEKHLEKSLKLYEAASGSKNYHCKTADCRGFYELMDANVRGFTCEVCLKVNCIGCKAIHQGKNCQQYQDEVNPNAKNLRENAESEMAIKNMIAADQAMFCPR